MSNPSEYQPLGVKKIISHGHFMIGMLDETTVLKYPSDPNFKEYKLSIQKEAAILRRLGRHPHIVEFLGLVDHGLKLRFYPQGTLHRYLQWHPHESIEMRMKWCVQLVQAVEFLHSRSVLHCDISLRNVLLNDDLDIILADFQGIIQSRTGETIIDGQARERPKSFMPRSDLEYADVRTDLFALGSAIYHIINGHQVFPELRNRHEGMEIQERFRNEMFPGSDYAASHVVERCWKGQYTAASEILSDVLEVQAVCGNARYKTEFTDCMEQ